MRSASPATPRTASSSWPMAQSAPKPRRPRSFRPTSRMSACAASWGGSAPRTVCEMHMSMTSSPYDRLQALGLPLLEPASPVGTYVPFKLSGNMLYLSGQGPRQADGRLMTGKVGHDLDVAEAYEHARLTGLNLVAVAHNALGDL